MIGNFIFQFNFSRHSKFFTLLISVIVFFDFSALGTVGCVEYSEALEYAFNRPIRSLNPNDPIAVFFNQTINDLQPASIQTGVHDKVLVSIETIHKFIFEPTVSPLVVIRKTISMNGPNMVYVKDHLLNSIKAHPDYSVEDLNACTDLSEVGLLIAGWFLQ